MREEHQQHSISAVVDSNGQIIIPEEAKQYLQPGLQITLTFQKKEATAPEKNTYETFGTRLLRELKSEGILGAWGPRDEDFAKKLREASDKGISSRELTE